MTLSFSPPTQSDPVSIASALRSEGFAVVDALTMAKASGIEADALTAWQPTWSDLPEDAYLKDGGRYRRRRHACFIVDDQMVEPVPHRPHWQPLEYNALHGGMERYFEPMVSGLVSDPAWSRLLVWLGTVATTLHRPQPWFTEAHQFRIDTTDGIGRPTPEGAHRDGVDLVAVFLVGRHDIKGGETRVFEANGRKGERFTLTEPWSVLLLDDARVIHESTPIQPMNPPSAQGGFRDTLVVTLRGTGFQGPSQL